jgi:hypothetical protein
MQHKNVETVIEKAMEEAFYKHFFNGEDMSSKIIKKDKIVKSNKIINAIKTMSNRSYWNRVNTIEAWGFATKIAIIFPGLLFGKQWWWLYIFAIISSVSLIWTSTKKTLPTIILFNVVWIILAIFAILKHFWWL